MDTYVHVLTPMEVEQGITLKHIQEYLVRGLFIDHGTAFVTDAPGPLLAGSVARCAFAAPVEFTGLNSAGLPVYRKVVI